MGNMFAKAKKMPVVKPAAAKSKKEELTIDGLEDFATLDALIKNLTTVRATLEFEVKNGMREIFEEKGLELKKRPENFRAVDGEASASCELKKRSSASVLKPEEVEALEAAGVPVGEEVKTEECFVINPAYTGNSELLEKVAKHLEKVKDLPEDFILAQEKVSKRVVSDETLDAVFAKGLVREFMETVTVMAIKPKLAKTDVAKALEAAKKLLGIEEEAA